MAVTEEIAVSKNSKVEAFALCAMVMSIPMVEYGQAVWMSSDIVGSGSKDTSKGCAEISLVFVFFFSISNCVLDRMYPAVDSAGCRAFAHESRKMLCAIFLLFCLHLKVWSP